MSDKITPEQLRKEAVAVERMHGETLTVDWRTKQANQLRAHADLLERYAKLKAHAEAMAIWLEVAVTPAALTFDEKWLTAYRRSYPKEDK